VFRFFELDVLSSHGRIWIQYDSQLVTHRNIDQIYFNNIFDVVYKVTIVWRSADWFALPVMLYDTGLVSTFDDTYHTFSVLKALPGHQLSYLHLGWWRGVAVTHCVESTKLLYGGPGYHLDG